MRRFARLRLWRGRLLWALGLGLCVRCVPGYTVPGDDVGDGGSVHAGNAGSPQMGGVGAGAGERSGDASSGGGSPGGEGGAACGADAGCGGSPPDPCAPNPCKNGGACELEPELTCKCLGSFSGPRCELTPDCSKNACDGFWSGTVTGKQVAPSSLHFEIRGSELAMVWFDWDVPTCGVVGSSDSVFSFGPAVIAGSFSSGVQTDEKEGTSYLLDGRFESSGAASGQMSFSVVAASCESTLNLSWKASRVVCGDYKVEWPETCDDGGSASDACSEYCQLPPYYEAEHEPNDDGTPQVHSDDFSSVQADGPFSADTLIFGNLSAGDEDIFSVTNDDDDVRTLYAETHGTTMGTCDIQTRLRVRTQQGGPADGAGVDQDSRGGLLHCSRLEYALSPHETVFVQVSQLDDEFPIPGYYLHLRFSNDR